MHLAHTISDKVSIGRCCWNVPVCWTVIVQRANSLVLQTETKRLLIWPQPLAPFSPANVCFLFAANSPHAEWLPFSKWSLVTNIFWYFPYRSWYGRCRVLCVMKKILWAPPSLFAIAKLNTTIRRLLPFSKLRCELFNRRSVEQTEQRCNQKFAVFGGLNRAPYWWAVDTDTPLT